MPGGKNVQRLKCKKQRESAYHIVLLHFILQLSCAASYPCHYLFPAVTSAAVFFSPFFFKFNFDLFILFPVAAVNRQSISGQTDFWLCRFFVDLYADYLGLHSYNRGNTRKQLPRPNSSYSMYHGFADRFLSYITINTAIDYYVLTFFIPVIFFFFFWTILL